MRKVLVEAIVASGLSAKELARRSGVPQPTITRLLQGADPRLSTVERIGVIVGLRLVREGEGQPREPAEVTPAAETACQPGEPKPATKQPPAPIGWVAREEGA